VKEEAMTDETLDLDALVRETGGHTPGPWHVKGMPKNVGGCRPIKAPGRCKYEIAFTTGLRHDGEDKANANLFAAAPALLAYAVQLRARVAELECAAREVWDSVPSTYEEGAETRRHAAALNALHAAVESPAKEAS
jgi:hypothetical protein